MSITRKRTFWVSLAAGSVFAAALLAIGKSRHRRTSIPHGRAPRGAGGKSRLPAWRFSDRMATLPPGRALRIQVSSPAMVHWTANQWDAVEDTRTTEIAPGVHVADLATEKLPPGARVQFTFYWPGVNRWEGGDFEVRVEPAAGKMVRTAPGEPD
jgi:hypothetical protein